MLSLNILDRTETLPSHRCFLRIEVRSRCVTTPLGLWSPESEMGSTCHLVPSVTLQRGGNRDLPQVLTS